MIKDFCGKDGPSALASISWDTTFVFANGSKAPAWRQVSGDIGYINAVPKDTIQFVITVSKKGYNVIKGYEKDATGSEVLNYEPLGELKVFPTLIELLKTKSPHFTDTIDKQKYKFVLESNNTTTTNGTGINQQSSPAKVSYAGAKSAGKVHESNVQKSQSQRFVEKNEPPNKPTQQKNLKKKVESVVDPNSKWK